MMLDVFKIFVNFETRWNCFIADTFMFLGNRARFLITVPVY